MPDPASPSDDEIKPVDADAPETDEQRADETIEREVNDAPVRDRTAEFEAAAAELKDRLMRAHAEMENLRRRTEREVQDARRYAVAGFARDMLAVADNLRRALESAASEPAVDGAAPVDPALVALVAGVGLTERELQKSLEKNGVKRLNPKGQMFDPHHHEAVFEAPDPSVPAGTVVQVMQEGYVIGDRILRPAMVGVARGGPKPGAAPEAAGVDRTA